MELYKDIRESLQSGDIVFYSSNDSLIDKLIKFVTRSEFSHMGLIFRLEGRVFLLEASLAGGIRMVPLTLRMPDYIFRFSEKYSWTRRMERKALAHIMEKYNVWEALRASLGFKEGSGWICTRYVAEVVEEQKYQFPLEHQVPQVFFDKLMKDEIPFISVDVAKSMEHARQHKQRLS